MKRNVIIVSLLALALLSACATVFPAPDLKGTITKVDDDSIVVTPAGGQPTTVTLASGTQVYWPNNTHAGPEILTSGQSVEVWLNGSQKASQIRITY